MAKSKDEVVDLERMREVWDKPHFRRIWEASARKAVDKAFSRLARDHHITGWKPIRFSQRFLAQTDFGTPKLESFALSDLEATFWEMDAGWECVDEAYRRICKVMRRKPDPRIDGDGGELLGGIGDFGDAWNEYQREYAMQKYGVDINFGN